MSDEVKVQTKGLNKKFLSIAIALIVAGLVAALVLLLPTSAKAKKVEEQLNLGAKYLSELNYEQAIVAYEAVIKMDPKCEEAYLALADIYIATGDFDKAEDILKQAEEEIGEDVTAAVEAKKQEVEEEREEQKAVEVPTSTPIPSPTELPTLIPTGTPTPSPTEAPTNTSTLTPVPTKVPTATPTPTVVPTAEGSVRVGLKLASDGFTYSNYEGKCVCTGLSEKGYIEFQKYGPANLVVIALPSISDTGNVVEGFWSQGTDGYGVSKMLTEDSAYVELECPDSYTDYYGVCNERYSSYINKLVAVILNDGLESIGDYAFYNCSGLSRITLPESVKEYGQNAFYGCENLKIDTIEMAGKTFSGGVFAQVEIGTIKLSGATKVNKSIGVWNDANVDKIEIAEGVEEIPAYTFMWCESVKEVKVPSSVTKIGDSAFFGCGGLSRITLPESVKEYGQNAFYGCENLKIDTIEMAGKTFSGGVFTQVEIGTIKLSGTTKVNKSIGVWNGANVDKIEIAEGVEEIPAYTFMWCESVKEVKVPSSVTSIGIDAFKECGSIVIHTLAGSYAEQWAKDNGVSVVAQ